ncbi:MAG TPA: hypothetical protein PK263_03680 [bacterium]|nr:hypothetical protein [bacterium]
MENFGATKRDLANYFDDAEYVQEVERINPRYSWRWDYDSPLLPLADGLEQKFLSIHETFKNLVPSSYEGKLTENIKDYIEVLLGSRRGEAIGIEFGGPGCKLFGGFEADIFRRTAGVTLTAPPSLNDPTKNRYGEQRHAIIAGNFFYTKTRREIEHWLAGKHADVIFERMVGGLNLLPNDRRIQEYIFNWWYRLLGENSVMFVQLPKSFFEDPDYLTRWIDLVKNSFSGSIDIISDGYNIRLNKLTGAPEKLPSLPQAM